MCQCEMTPHAISQVTFSVAHIQSANVRIDCVASFNFPAYTQLVSIRGVGPRIDVPRAIVLSVGSPKVNVIASLVLLI